MKNYKISLRDSKKVSVSFSATEKDAEIIFNTMWETNDFVIYCVTDNEDVTQKFLAGDD